MQKQGEFKDCVKHFKEKGSPEASLFFGIYLLSLYLASDVIQYIDLGQDPNRLAMFNHDQSIS